MLERIFPRVADNHYSGHWLGIVLFVLVAAVKATQGLNSIIMTHDVMTMADGIPVDTYGSAAAAAAMSMVALLGMYGLVIPLIGIVVLIRYRALVPFLLVMLLLVQLGSRLLQTLNPIERIADPAMGFAGHAIGFWMNLGLLALTAVGLVLSLMQRANPRQQPSVEGAR